MLPCRPLFAVHTGAWSVARFGARALESFWFVRTAEDAAHCTVAASVPDKIPNLPKISGNFFFNEVRVNTGATFAY
jgi:hypothetical protein